MNLVELYKKVPTSKHGNIKVIGNTVVFDSGATIYQAYIDEDGELIPANQATKEALRKLWM